MITLKVNLGERSYPICIGQNLLSQSELITQHIPGNSALIVTNKTVAPLYLQQLEQSLEGIRHQSLILEDGEEYKNLEVLSSIYDFLLKNRYDRNTTLIALGGGASRRHHRLCGSHTPAWRAPDPDPHHPALPGGFLGRR